MSEIITSSVHWVINWYFLHL